MTYGDLRGAVLLFFFTALLGANAIGVAVSDIDPQFPTPSFTEIAQGVFPALLQSSPLDEQRSRLEPVPGVVQAQLFQRTPVARRRTDTYLIRRALHRLLELPRLPSDYQATLEPLPRLAQTQVPEPHSGRLVVWNGALHCARDAATVQRLRALGADVKARDRHGKTPIEQITHDLCRGACQETIDERTILERAGAIQALLEAGASEQAMEVVLFQYLSNPFEKGRSCIYTALRLIARSGACVIPESLLCAYPRLRKHVIGHMHAVAQALDSLPTELQGEIVKLLVGSIAFGRNYKAFDLD